MLIVYYLIGATLGGLLGRVNHSMRGKGPCRASMVLVWGRGGPMPPSWWDPIMSRVIAVMACGFMLAACSATMPSLDFLRSAPQPETLAVESEPPGAEAKTSLGESCRTPCKLSVQPGSEFSVTLALSGYQSQTVSVRPEAEGAPRLAPNPIHVDLRQAAPPKKLVAKKKKPVAAAARPAAPPPMASAAPAPASTPAPTSAPAPAPAPAPALAPAPAAPTEAAPSATNYPWPSR